MSPPDEAEAPPPFLGTWPRLYTAVIVELAVVIAAFALLTVWAS
jgi:hypothetical protein